MVKNLFPLKGINEVAVNISINIKKRFNIVGILGKDYKVF